jgi:hypothetical protein
MRDLSYHILDIVRNSLHAGASVIETIMTENSHTGLLTLTIRDNGQGMSKNLLERVCDPFFTTSATKKVGLGIPLLKQNAEMTGGTCTIESAENQGTQVMATFNSDHIDMIPRGDLALTFRNLISGNPDRDIIFRYRLDEGGFDLDTAVIRRELEGVRLNTREVLDYISEFIRDNLTELDKTAKIKPI